jgi:transmembrane sensor
MSVNSERVRTLITGEAAGWFVANRAGLAARERNTFAAWLKASPLHVQEYLAISVIARDLPEACRGSEASLDALLDRARIADDAPPEPRWPPVLWRRSALASHGWPTAALAMALAGILIVGGLALRILNPFAHAPTPEVPTVFRFATGHGEQQAHQLEDHSVLHLNTDSAVTVRYSRTERLVTLTSGEVLFEVAHEPKRSFRVQAGFADLVDIGTKFNVRLQQHATVVTVLEGRVAAGPTSMSAGRKPGSNQGLPPGFVALGAGQQVSIAQDRSPAAPIAVDAQRTAAWLHRQIQFEQEALERVAAEFNRYTPKPIEIVTPALQHMEISGVFATDDTEAFIAFLRSLEGVRVEITAARIRVSADDQGIVH